MQTIKQNRPDFRRDGRSRESKATRFPSVRSSVAELPGRGQADAAAALEVIPAVHVRPAAARATDEDVSAVPVHARGASVDVGEEPLVPHLVVDGDEPVQLGGVRHALDIQEQELLLVRGLAGRALDDCPLDREPARAGLVGVRELLRRIEEPGVPLTEVRGREHVVFGERLGRGGRRHQSVAVIAVPLEYLLRRQGTSELCDLRLAIGHRLASCHHLLGRDEVLAQDRASESVVGRSRREATDTLLEVFQELPATGNESLESRAVELDRLDRGSDGLVYEVAKLPALIRRDRQRSFDRHRRLLSLPYPGPPDSVLHYMVLKLPLIIH